MYILSVDSLCEFCEIMHFILVGNDMGRSIRSSRPLAKFRDHWQKTPQTQYSCGFEGCSVNHHLRRHRHF